MAAHTTVVTISERAIERAHERLGVGDENVSLGDGGDGGNGLNTEQRRNGDEQRRAFIPI